MARGQAHGQQEEGETEEEEEAPEEDEEDVCMPKLWVDSPAQRVLVPVQLLLMMSLHFVSGSLGRCLPVA